jgi:hypothetical protein
MALPVTTKRSPNTWIIDLKCIVKVVAKNIDKDKGPHQLPFTLVRRELVLKFSNLTSPLIVIDSYLYL